MVTEIESPYFTPSLGQYSGKPWVLSQIIKSSEKFLPLYNDDLIQEARRNKRDKMPYFVMDPGNPGYTSNVPV